MGWPIHSDYSMMVQNPKIAFRDPGLKSCHIERDALGQPSVMSGAFAVVYKGRLKGGAACAIRAFTSEQKERRERYEAISSYLGSKKLRCLVPFRYRDDGIRSKDGKWYPVVAMDWVPGEILFEWVRARCKGKDKRALKSASDRWLELVDELAKARIAHGDLQHANIMVTSTGDLKLVDYDCMCVPTLEGKPNLEIGVEPYQHPKRDSRTRLTPQLDHFSALFIFIALRGLASAPELWQEYVEKQCYDKLLIKPEDFIDPTKGLFKRLQAIVDPDLRQMIDALLQSRQQPLERVPSPAQVLGGYRQVEALLSQRSWDDAIALLGRRPGQGADAPPHLQPQIAEAKKRIACRLALEKAVASGDEAAIAKYFQPQLLDDYPRAQTVATVARQKMQAVDALKQAQQLRQQRAWRKLASHLDRHQTVFRGTRAADPLFAEAAAWRERNQLCSQVEQLALMPDPDIRLLDERWRRLQSLGGHPELAGRVEAISRILRRSEAWHAFKAVPQTVRSYEDLQLLRAWSEPLFKGWPPAERERPRMVEAKDRLLRLQQLQQLASEAPRTVKGEEKLVAEAGLGIPPGYDAAFEARLQESKAAIEKWRAFQDALAEPISDLKLAQAVRGLEDVGRGEWIPAAWVARIDLAKRRLPLLLKLRTIPLSRQPDELDARLLEVWDDELLDSCTDALSWVQLKQQARKRQQLLLQLESAIDRGDDARVFAIFANPLMCEYPLSEKLAAKASTARESFRAVESILNAGRINDRAALIKHFDAALVRKHAQALAVVGQPLLQLLESELRKAARLGLEPPKVAQAVVLSRVPRLEYKIRWIWPEAKWSDACVLAVCNGPPRPTDTPHTECLTVSAWEIGRQQWEAESGCWRVPWRGDLVGLYAVVWVKLDFGALGGGFSEPLELGRLG